MDLRRALLNGRLGDLNPFPWVMMTGNCLGWIVYGYYLEPKDGFIVAGNVPGLVISLWLNLGAAKLQYKQVLQDMWQQQLRAEEEEEQNAKSSHTSNEHSSSGDEDNHSQTNGHPHHLMTDPHKETTDTTIATLPPIATSNAVVLPNALTMIKNGQEPPPHPQYSYSPIHHLPAPTVLLVPSDHKEDQHHLVHRSHGAAARSHPPLTVAPSPSKLQHLVRSRSGPYDSTYTTSANSSFAGATSVPMEELVLVPQEVGLLRILCAWIVVLVWVGWMGTSRQGTISTIGIVVNLNLVFFYAAPLKTMQQVIFLDRHSNTIHRPTMYMSLTASCFSFLYGVAKRDPIIELPNAMGVIMGLIQVLLCFCFPKRIIPPEGGDDTDDQQHPQPSQVFAHNDKLLRKQNEEEQDEEEGYASTQSMSMD